MSINLTRVLSILESYEIPSQNAGTVLSIAAARAIGYCLNLPTSTVSVPATYYIQNEKTLADAAVSQINEVIPIDVERTSALIQAVWTFRYRLVYNASNQAVRGFLDGLIRAGANEMPGYVSEVMIDLPDSNVLDVLAAQIKEGFQGE